jgi:hypothetical protein
MMQPMQQMQHMPMQQQQMQLPQVPPMPQMNVQYMPGYVPQQYVMPMQGYMQQPYMQPMQTQPETVPVMQAQLKSEASESTRDSEDQVSDSSSVSSAMPERPAVAEDLARALASLAPGRAPYVFESLQCFAAPERAQDFAFALYSAAEPELVRPVVELVGALQSHFQLAHKVWEYCKEDLPFIAGESPPARAHGTVLLAAELFAHGLLSFAEIKELFAVLLFAESHPEDHAVSLACHAFLVAGPILDRSHLGQKMVEYVVLRLKEVKGLNLTIATRKSITEVVELQRCMWDANEAARSAQKDKSSGQKKARAAARVRARGLIDRIQAGAEDPWAGLWNDARALVALLEFAACGDVAAQAAVASAPKDLHDTLRVVASPETLQVLTCLQA